MKYFNWVIKVVLYTFFVLLIFLNLRDMIGDLLYNIMSVSIWITFTIYEFLRIYRLEGKEGDYFNVIALIIVGIISFI